MDSTVSNTVIVPSANHFGFAYAGLSYPSRIPSCFVIALTLKER